MTAKELMLEAIRLSENNVRNGGGPFGEVNAIRAACARLGTFDLSGCELYSSCEPCPMCLGAINWAHLDKLYYGNDKKDAAGIGFDDAFIYRELDLKPEDRALKSERLLPDKAIEAFRQWADKADKVEY